MTVRSRCVVTGVISFALGCALTTQLVRGQAASKVDGEFTHVSLAVRDVDKTAKAVAANKLERGVQIRLVLGHDVAGRAIAAWLDAAAEERLAAVTQGGGWVLI